MWWVERWLSASALGLTLAMGPAIAHATDVSEASDIDEEDEVGPNSAGDRVVHVWKYRPGEGVTLSTKGGHQVRLFGYMQPFAEHKVYDGDPNPSATRYRMRRLRLRLSGRFAQQRLSYRFQADLAGATEADVDEAAFLLDAFIAANVNRTLKLTFGQRATYTDNRELFMLSHTLQLPERSRLTSAFSAIREIGFFVEDRKRFGQSSHYIKPYFVLTTGDGASFGRLDRGGMKVGGRLDYLPFGLFNNFGQFRQVDMVREKTPKLVVGAAYSYNAGMSSRRGRASGAIVYLNADDQESLPDFGKLGVDFLFKYRGLSILGEFTKTWAYVPDDITQRVRNDGSVSTAFDGDVDAYVRGRMMLGEGYNVQAGYLLPFRVSLDARYTYLRPDENSFLNNGTFYNRQSHTTGGLSVYPAFHYGIKAQASLTRVNALDGSNDIQGDPIAGDEWIGRVTTTLAF